MLISSMMTVGVSHSRRYCNTGYGPSLKDGDLQHSSALAQSPEVDIEPQTIRQKINLNLGQQIEK